MKSYNKISASERYTLMASDAGYRRHLFLGLLKHIRKGRSLDCYGPIGEKTIGECLKNYPLEFVQGELDEALRDAKEWWEELGARQADGSCLGNSRSWYYNMSHRYKWSDRIDIRAEHSGAVAVSIVNYASQKPSTTIGE
jgi:hypothetical protein